MKTRHFMIAAGGTGGHVFPALALGEELLARGHRVSFLLDQRVSFPENSPNAPKAKVHRIHLPHGRGRLQKLKLLAGIVRVFLQTKSLFCDVDGLIVFGGYPVVPALLRALMGRIPYIIHEQNALMGRVTRFFARWAYRVALTFPIEGFQKTIVTGMPIRKVFYEVESGYYPPQEGPIRLLIIGGSQGASVMSQAVVKAIVSLPVQLRQRLMVSHQSRPEDQDTVILSYKEAGVEAVVQPFFQDIVAHIAHAHLVISRAGASSLCEITFMGRPSFLIPYPFAKDRHQDINAHFLRDQGAAEVFQESSGLQETLANRIENVLVNTGLLIQMAERSRSLAVPQSGAILADCVETI